VYFNVNFDVFFKLIKVNLLVSELYIYQNARCNGKQKQTDLHFHLYELVFKLFSLSKDKGSWR